MLPPAIMKVAEFLGFGGDRTLALELLSSSFEANSSDSPFAALFLLMYYLNLSEMVGDYNPHHIEKAEIILNWANAKFERGIFFGAMSVRFYRAKRQLVKAYEQAARGFEDSDELPGLKFLFVYHQGWCALLQFEWIVAIEQFTRLFSTREEDKNNFEALYKYIIACCHGICANVEEAVKQARQVPSMQTERLRPMDAYIQRKADRVVGGRIRFALDIFELFYQFSAFAHLDESLLKAVRETVLRAEDEASLAGNRFSYSDLCRKEVLLSYTAYGLNDTETAIIHAEKALTFESKVDSDTIKDGVIAHGYYILCRSLLDKNQYDKAETVLSRGEALSNYDLVRMMRFRLHSLRQTISIKKKESK